MKAHVHKSIKSLASSSHRKNPIHAERARRRKTSFEAEERSFIV